MTKESTRSALELANRERKKTFELIEVIKRKIDSHKKSIEQYQKELEQPMARYQELVSLSHEALEVLEKQ
jgi:hypothetical protein